MAVPCALLLAALSLLTASAAQQCVPQAVPGMVIDIGQAVARGARFTDPLSLMSVEECLSACCAEREAGGDLHCNFLVFDARKGAGLQNCYLFHCPAPGSCPLVPNPGVLSYRLWTEPSSPRDPAPEPQQPKSSDRSRAQSSSRKPPASAESGPLDPALKKTSAAIASQGSARHPAKEDPSGFTTQLLRVATQQLADVGTKPKGEVRAGHPSPTASLVPALRTATVHGEVKNVASDAKAAKPGRVMYKKPEDLKSYLPATAPAANRTKLQPSTAAPQPAPRTEAGLAVPADVSGARSDVQSAKRPEGDHAVQNGAPKEVGSPLPLTEVPGVPTARSGHAQLATRPAPLRTEPSAKTHDQPYTGGETPERPPPAEEPAVRLGEAPRKAEGARPSLEDKSGLVAALVFGMLFLMVVIGLVSRKVSEARRRHRYTKLDYLINGMYVDT